MPRKEYISITIPRDTYELATKLRRKYNIPLTELITRSLILYDHFNELLNAIRTKP